MNPAGENANFGARIIEREGSLAGGCRCNRIKQPIQR
jgi:hypothetical protein